MAFGIYGKAGELVENINEVIARGEPIIVLAPQLMEAGMSLIGRVGTLVDAAERSLARTDHTLARLEHLATMTESYLAMSRDNVALETRRLELEILRLERDLMT